MLSFFIAVPGCLYRALPEPVSLRMQIGDSGLRTLYTRLSPAKNLQSGHGNCTPSKSIVSQRMVLNDFVIALLDFDHGLSHLAAIFLSLCCALVRNCPFSSHNTQRCATAAAII